MTPAEVAFYEAYKDEFWSVRDKKVFLRGWTARQARDVALARSGRHVLPIGPTLSEAHIGSLEHPSCPCGAAIATALEQE